MHASEPGPDQARGLSRTLLSWGSLGLAAAESLCLLFVGLSGIRVAIGMTALVAATAGGPAHGFHRSALRIPFLTLGGLGAVLNLFLAWNEERLRRNPASAWRMRPLSKKQRRSRWLQVTLSVVTLLLILGEVITHPWFHHEL
ncbi:MAG: hypothetical protein JST79_14080 [Acidobacteria bacterium]|nr:hypothetical protein [Acidobacteriota bacterium]